MDGLRLNYAPRYFIPLLSLYLTLLRISISISSLNSFIFPLSSLLQVSQKERTEAQKLFTSPAGMAYANQLESAHNKSTSSAQGSAPRPALTESQKKQIKKAIEMAKTKEEIDHIELQLKVSIAFI